MNSITAFGPKHYVRQAQTDIQQICQPLFDKLGLNYFHYAKFYKDGSLCIVHNRIDWSDYFYQQNYQTAVPLANDSIQIGKYNLCLWRGTLNNQVVSDARNICNFDHPLSISIPRADHFECFAFGTFQGNDSIINSYFNNLELIINFTEYFKLQAADIVKKVDQDRLILPKKIQASQLNLLKDLSNTITVNGYYGIVNVSMKELDVLRMLCRSMTAKEIAQRQNRSTRTIEMHINNLKAKLGCSKRSQLLAIALENNIIC